MWIGFVLEYQKPEQKKLKKFSLLLTINFYLSMIVSGSTIQNVSDLPKHMLDGSCQDCMLSPLQLLSFMKISRGVCNDIQILTNLNQCQFHYVYRGEINFYQLKICLTLPCSASRKHTVYLHVNAKHPIKAFFLLPKWAA